MKKILTFALTALMIISMTGCAGNDNTQKEQEKVVTSFFDSIKEYKLDELEKISTDDYTDVLDIASLTDGLKDLEDENVYSESFIKETNNFIKKVFDKLIKEYKITFDEKEENTVLVKGKMLDEKSIDMTSAQENINELIQKYQEENMEELSKIYLEQGQEAMMIKIFDDLSKELYNPLYTELDNAKYTDFTFKFEMIEKDGKWLIDKISKE